MSTNGMDTDDIDPGDIDPDDDKDGSTSFRPNRRAFLGLAGAIAAGGAALKLGGFDSMPRESGTGAGDGDGGGGGDDGATARPAPAAVTSAAATADRTLVVIELRGGNDGLATVLPYGDGRLVDLRGNLLPDTAELHTIDDHWAFHPELAPISERLAVLQGVGTPQPSGSHFEMETRWHTGVQAGGELPYAGFLGRLCDQLDVGAPVTGLSLARAVSPMLRSEKAATLGLPGDDGARLLGEEGKWFDSLRRGLSELGMPGSADSPLVGAARIGLGRAVEFADLVSDLEVDTDAYPGGRLARDLALAATLIDADVGVRVLHVEQGGYDTHDDQRGSHGRLMSELAAAVAAFEADLAARGRSEQVLVATVSEFGRRPSANGGGTDHGAASCALLTGPVVAGLHGDAPSLTRLDTNDNLAATVLMDRYYATLAEGWLGVPAGEVLPGTPRPLTDLLL